MRRSPVLFAVALAASLPASALAAKRCDRCKDLPMLEDQLFQQEFLQEEFRKFASEKKVPDPTAQEKKEYLHPEIAAMQREAAADFNAWLKSPAGGGNRKSHGGAEFATNPKGCGLTLYIKDAHGNQVYDKDKNPVTKPFDDAEEKKYREQNCDTITDFQKAHEAVHQAACNEVSLDIFGDWIVSAANDVKAYGAGVRLLRDRIAQLATDCGWEGSTNPTKKNAIDGNDETTVPTRETAIKLGHALKGGRK